MAPKEVLTSEQLRQEIGGFDLDPEKIIELIAGLNELGLSEYDPPIPGHYATVYFIPTDAGILLPGNLRYRIYGLPSERAQNLTRINADDVGVLEIKRKPQSYPVRIEHKSRQTCSAATVNQVINHPGAAYEILFSSQTLQPPNYPTGRICKAELQEYFSGLQAKGGLSPSLVISSSRRHFVKEPSSPDDLRVTIDFPTFFYGFNPANKEGIFGPIIPISGYPFARTEIKIVESSLAPLGKEVLIQLQKLGHRPPVRKAGFQAYFRKFYGAVDRKAIQPIFKTNEAPGLEIESKLEIPNGSSIDQIAAAIYLAFDSDFQKPFIIHPISDLRHIKESHTHAIRYGYQTGQSWKEAFVITDRPENSWVGIKRKSRDTAPILFRTEERETLKWPRWTPHAQEETIEAEAVRLGVQPDEIVKIGETNRRKLKIYVQNRLTYRLYIISVDESITDSGEVLKQVEIEYGGRTGIHAVTEGAKAQISQDIETLTTKVIEICSQEGIPLEQTTKTKFDFLLALLLAKIEEAN